MTQFGFTFNIHYGESRKCTDKLFSLSRPYFYAESDSVNDSHKSIEDLYSR